MKASGGVEVQMHVSETSALEERQEVRFSSGPLYHPGVLKWASSGLKLSRREASNYEVKYAWSYPTLLLHTC